MSTNISDLPGPEEEEEDTQQMPMQPMQPMQTGMRDINDEALHIYNTPVRSNVYKKKVQYKVENKEVSLYDTIIKYIHEQFNIKTVLVFLMIYFSASRYSDEYTRKFFMMFNIVLYNVTILKSVLLLVLYIMLKFVLEEYI